MRYPAQAGQQGAEAQALPCALTNPLTAYLDWQGRGLSLTRPRGRPGCRGQEGACVSGLFYALTHGMTQRRFPAPWSMREIPGGFAVSDATGRTLAYVYAAEGQRLSAMPQALSWDEARRIAAGIVRLPELLAQTR